MKTNGQKLDVKYGFLLGVIAILWVGLEFRLAIEFQFHELADAASFLGLLIPVFFVYIALREKKIVSNGNLNCVNALKSGARMGVIAGLISGLFLALYLYFFPEVMESYFLFLTESLRMAGESQETIDHSIQDFGSLYNPWVQGLFMFIGTLGTTFVISGIFGYLMRTKKPTGKKVGKGG